MVLLVDKKGVELWGVEGGVVFHCRRELLHLSAVTTLLVYVKTLPKFLSPYVAEMIEKVKVVVLHIPLHTIELIGVVFNRLCVCVCALLRACVCVLCA